MKILMIGNSHGLDATRMLWDVFKAESPDEEIVVGALYINGCSMVRHAEYARLDQPLYVYFKNTDGVWESTREYTVRMGLQDEEWDLIVMQEMNTVAGMESRYETDDMNTLVDFIHANTKGNPRLVWQMMWSNPTDPSFFQPGTKTMDMPAGWDERYQLRNNLSRVDLYEHIVACNEKYILPRKDIDLVIPSGTAVQYARFVQGLTDNDLNRDYTHLSEYTRLLVSYVWYAFIRGIEKLDEVKLDRVRLAVRFTNKRANPTEDLLLTDRQRELIRDAVNYTLANPYKMP